MHAPERGSDRADMERIERDDAAADLVSFVELRAAKPTGRILSCTVALPAAAEIASCMGNVITNRLTVADVARSAHSYPSHGYLLHHIALSMALSSIVGEMLVWRDLCEERSCPECMTAHQKRFCINFTN